MWRFPLQHVRNSSIAVMGSNILGSEVENMIRIMLLIVSSARRVLLLDTILSLRLFPRSQGL